MTCDLTYSLGCIGSCFTFDTGLIAPQDGPLTLVYKFMGAWQRIEIEATQGDPILIPSGTFNESDDVEFEIWTDTCLGFEFDGIQYSRFKITTQPGTPGCCAATYVI